MGTAKGFLNGDNVTAFVTHKEFVLELTKNNDTCHAINSEISGKKEEYVTQKFNLNKKPFKRTRIY